MNKLIRAQLEKVTVTDLDFNEDTTSILIPKTVKLGLKSLNVGGCFAITLSDVLLRMPSNSTLAVNWNGGNMPTSKKYMIEVLDKMNNMIKVNGAPIGISAQNFRGWIPIEYIESVDAKL